MSFSKQQAEDERDRRRKRFMIFLATAAGVLFAFDLSFAASNWTVGLNPGSSGEAASGTVANLTISAVASPSPANLLYPGVQGDVVLTITNPNNYPVTVSDLQFPSNLTGAAGYSNSNLSVASAEALCTGLTSGVTWTYSTATSGANHTLATPLVVGASASLTVTLTNFATMSSSSPAACENSYFSMPSLAGVTATAGGSPVTTSPATDS